MAEPIPRPAVFAPSAYRAMAPRRMTAPIAETMYPKSPRYPAMSRSCGRLMLTMPTTLIHWRNGEMTRSAPPAPTRAAPSDCLRRSSASGWSINSRPHSVGSMSSNLSTIDSFSPSLRRRRRIWAQLSHRWFTGGARSADLHQCRLRVSLPGTGRRIRADELHDAPFESNWERQEDRVERGAVEPLAEVARGCDEDRAFEIRYGQLVHDVTPCLLAHAAAQDQWRECRRSGALRRSPRDARSIG